MESETLGGFDLSINLRLITNEKTKEETVVITASGDKVGNLEDTNLMYHEKHPCAQVASLMLASYVFVKEFLETSGKLGQFNLKEFQEKVPTKLSLVVNNTNK